MKHLLTLVSLFILSATAHAAPPTAESVAKLLDAMHAEQSTAALMQSMEGVMRNAIAQAMKGKSVTPEQSAQADVLRSKFMQVIQEELSWEKLKPMNVQIYSETFSQEEVDGLIAFYQSPVGESYIAKMPLALQKSMSLMQTKMVPLMQRFAQITKEAAEASAARAAPKAAQ